MKAILVPYAVDQNAPSRPLPQLWEVPEDIDQRDQELRELFSKNVMQLDEDDELTIHGDGSYGDLHIEYGGDIFLFVTYIDG